MGPLKMRKDFRHFFPPEIIAHFFVYAIVAKNGQLAVLYRHIDQNGIMRGCLSHFQNRKNFRGAVKRLYITATAFNIQTDLSAGLMFRLSDSSDDLLFFFFRKKILFL